MASLDVTLMREIARARFAAAMLPRGFNRDPYFIYLDAMASALQKAVDLWRVQAVISDVTIMGPAAIGGKVTPPALEGFIRGYAPAGSWDVYSRAIAAGVHNQFRTLFSGPLFSGQPLYPAFAAIPMPMAPPTPNVPWPLQGLALPNLVAVEPYMVRDEIVRKYPTPKPKCADAVAIAIAEGFSKVVRLWMGQQQITLLMGTGRVPAFAPPYVPVGTVVNGYVLPKAGSLAA